MHHCLHLDEILGLIFDHITISTYETKNALDGPTLLAFLKTCRSISVPAAARLWRSLPSFVPLLLTMPEDLVEIEEHGEHLFTPRTVVSWVQFGIQWFNQRLINPSRLFGETRCLVIGTGLIFTRHL